MRRVENEKSISFFWAKKVSRQMIEDLKKSVRFCLHNSPESPLHTMIIVARRGRSYPFHRHLTTSESFYIIEVEMLAIIRRKMYVLKKDEGIAVPKNIWHTLYPLTKVAVYRETKAGPFRPEETVYA